MSIENILKEYLQRYGIHEVQFSQQGMFSHDIENLGTFSCEHIPDGIILALFQEIAPSEKTYFMEKALKASNPIENTSQHHLRPVLYNSQAGLVTAIQKEAISLPTISTVIDMLFRTLQNTLRA